MIATAHYGNGYDMGHTVLYRTVPYHTTSTANSALVQVNVPDSDSKGVTLLSLFGAKC
jgi:hypothetical protein